MSSRASPPLAIIGGGNMAQAILRGGLGSILDARRVVVAEPDAGKHEILGGMGVGVVPTGREALCVLEEHERAGLHAGGGQILLAIKPQMLGSVAVELSPMLGDGSRVVITILAGTPSQKVREGLGGRGRIVRAMPNLPAAVRMGATAVSRGAGALPGDEAFALELFGTLGPLVIEIDESLMDAFTAIAGSGPAYVFYLAEAMQEAAVRMGFGGDAARRIVAQTIAGAGAMLGGQGEGSDAASLRASVTSKGGTTEAAIGVMDGRGVSAALIEAMIAARDRGSAISKAT